VGKVRTPFIRLKVGIGILGILVAACSGTATPAPSGTAPAGTGTPAPTDAGPTPTPNTEPIVIGGTLSLTGAFGATGTIHRIAGELFIDRLNDAGGLLGRPVEWIVLDDESNQANVATLYERLITEDEVDLIMGPYATPNILSAMGVAERHGFVLPQHTAVIAPLMTYECQFPAWSIGPAPNEYVPNQMADALESLSPVPRKIALVTNQNGSTDFVTSGLADDPNDPGMLTILPDRGFEIVAEINYPPGTSEWGPIATQIRDAAPDVVINDGLGVDIVGLVNAMSQLNYEAPLAFSLFPAPGPPLGLGAAGEGILSVTIFEPNDAVLDRLDPEAREIVDEFETRAAAESLPYTVFETQAAASWNAWEILVAGVESSGGLDNEAICDDLHANGADTTFSGELTFPPDDNNFWPSTLGLKQIQDGDWIVVWPEAIAAAPLRGPGS
jgi:branched-chain amino acid transport system substrate-binding protein